MNLSHNLKVSKNMVAMLAVNPQTEFWGFYWIWKILGKPKNITVRHTNQKMNRNQHKGCDRNMPDHFFFKPYQSVIYSSQNPLLAIWTWLWLWLCIFCSLTGVYRISRIKAMLLRLSWCGAASTVVEHSAEEQEEPRNTETAAAWNFLCMYVHLHFSKHALL